MPEQEQQFAKQKRLEEFKDWLSTFKEYYEKRFEGKTIQYSENAHFYLNEWYWTRRETDILPYMEAENGDEIITIKLYKIISGLELAIIGFQPIEHEDEDEQAKLNADLAWFIALTVLISWNNHKDAQAIHKALETKDFKGFVTEHQVWLAKLDPRYNYPIFSNSHTWWNFHTALKFYLEKHKS
jgi:hypothetical protein